MHVEIAPPIVAFVSVLMFVVMLMLLIVCTNVANLVLARAASRQVEMAIRQSIGAGRGRLIRQLLTENLLLSGAGALGGLAFAYWCTRLLMAAELPVPVPLALDLPIDWRVLGFTALVAMLATALFGIAPAMAASRVDLVGVIKGFGGPDRRHGRARATFPRRAGVDVGAVAGHRGPVHPGVPGRAFDRHGVRRQPRHHGVTRFAGTRLYAGARARVRADA